MAVSINSRAMKPKGVLRADLEVADYAELRLYAGAATTLFVTGSGIAGTFVRDATVTVDNGGTQIVGVHGWRRVFDGALLVEWFGAVADWNGATGTDNYTAFSSAISAATASRRPLQASGRYYVEFGAGRDRLSVAGDLVVCGTSKYASEVKFGPADVAKAIRGFDVASGADFTIRDIKLTSPALTVYPLFDNLLAWTPIWFAVDSSTLLIERCYFGDQWYGTQVSGGAGGTNAMFIVRDSYLRGYNGAFIINNNLAAKAWVIAQETTFQGHKSEGSDWSGRGHCLYPHPHISLLIEGCRFLGGGRSQINHFSSAGVPHTDPPPELVNIRDSYFGECTAQAMLTSNLDTMVVVDRCVFDGVQGVTGRCDVVMNACSAINGGTLGAPYNSDGVSNYMRSMQFNNCWGEVTSAGSPLFLTKDQDVTSSGTRAKVVVNGGYFKISSGNVIYHRSAITAEVNDAVVEWLGGAYNAVLVDTGHIRFNRCRFVGAFTSGGVINNTGTGTVELNECVFDVNTAGGALVQYNAAANTVSGRGNSVLSASQFRGANAQGLQLKEGRNPITVASAATLILSQNFNYHRVSGAAAISRIRLGAQDDYNKHFSTRLWLVVDSGGTWSLSNAANIVPISTAPRVANEVVELYYDPSVDKWYEV
jgi:hypothetical protein